MSSNIIYDPTFPHGTRTGYRDGCRGAHCPSTIPCRDVYRRYNGDYGYKKRIDSGLTAAEIAEIEARQAHELAQQAKPKRRKTKSTGRTRPLPERWSHDYRHRMATIAKLHSEGLQDHQIAQHVGLSPRQVCTLRNDLGLPSNRKLGQKRIAELHAQGYTDAEIAEKLGRDRSSVTSSRRHLGLPLNPERKQTHESQIG